MLLDIGHEIVLVSSIVLSHAVLKIEKFMQNLFFPLSKNFPTEAYL